MSDKYPTVNVRVSHTQLAWLQEHAKKRGLTISDFVKRLMFRPFREADILGAVEHNTTGAKRKRGGTDVVDNL